MKLCKKLLVFLVVISFLSISKLSAMSSSSSSGNCRRPTEEIELASVKP
ncbi:hypothetical protein HRU45_03440, partial [Candidatus Dependentiae bacterium]|nr:hypothetical protein [Candidatus Dependentiae bacterium]